MIVSPVTDVRAEIDLLRFGRERMVHQHRRAQIQHRTRHVEDPILELLDVTVAQPREALEVGIVDGLEPETILARRSSLEDVFLRRAGRSLKE